jgi:WD40 repeat protein
MAHFDRVLVGPTRDETADAVRAAAQAVEGPTSWIRLAWLPAERERFLGQLADEPEGQRQWVGAEAHRRVGDDRSVVAAAWWHDFTGRLHLRLFARRDRLGPGLVENLFGPGPRRPPLALVYPERTLVRFGPGGDEVLALCACGASGPATGLGWMGACCGPCHDRAASGEAVPPNPDVGWPLAAEDAAPVLEVTPAPDGAALASLDGGGYVRVWEAATGEPRTTFRLPVKDPRSIDVLPAPGGRTLAYALTSAGAWAGGLWDVATRSRLTALDGRPYAFSPDGGELFLVRRGAASACDARTGAHRHSFLTPNDRPVHHLALAPGGGRLAGTNVVRREVLLWETGQAGVAGVYPDPFLRLSYPAFTRDGRPFYVVRAPRQVAALLRRVEGTEAERPLAGWVHEPVAHLSFAPDASHLAARGEHTVRVWRLTDREGAPHLEGRGNALRRCDFLPDGRLLTFSPRDNAVRLWPADLFRA